MPDDITSVLPADPDAIFNAAVEFIQTTFPGWEPSEAQVVTILAQAIALMEAESRDLMSAIQDVAFKYFGISILQLPVIDATYATVSSTWTFKDDTGGYEVADDTMVSIERGDGSTALFLVVDGFTVDPGDTTVAGVTLIAQDPGAENSGIGSGSVELVEVADYVTGIALAGLTSGGEDGETDDDYIARLKEELTILSASPIVAKDYEILARSRFVSVTRALCVPLYDPDTNTGGHGGYVAVSVIDEDGVALSGGEMSSIDTYFDAIILENVVYKTFAPTTTSIDATFTAVALPGYDTTEVHDNIIAAIEEFLSPANWGKTPGSDGNDWRLVDKVRITEVSEVVNRVEGVDYVTAITVEGGTSDVTLTGAAPLTSAGTITGTVS